MTKRQRMNQFHRKIERIVLLLHQNYDPQQKDTWEYRVSSLLEHALFVLDMHLESTTLDE